MTKKGFVLSWFYPPGNSSEGLVTYKLLSHSHYEYDVFTRTNQNHTMWDRKITEKDLVSKNINVICGKYENEKKWAKAAIEYYLKNRDKYDFIMTRSMPPEAHNFGYQIKKEYPETKWIASFGDPLKDTPYYEYILAKNSPEKVQKYIDERHPGPLQLARFAVSPTRSARQWIWDRERKKNNSVLDYMASINDMTVKNSDLIIVNNNYELEHIVGGKFSKYKNKAVVIPHPYMEELIPKTPKKEDEKISFIYAGHLDELRNAQTFLKAITKLKKYDKNLCDRIKVDFYGHMSDQDKVYIAEHNLGDIIAIHQDITYGESLAKTKASDWAILFDANFENPMDENIYFAAKLADYLGTKTKVFAITNPKGASADIIRETNCGIVSTHAIDDIFMKLSQIIYGKIPPIKMNTEAISQYEASKVASKMDEAIRRLIKGE